MAKEKTNQNKISKLEQQQLKCINNPEKFRRIQGKIDTLKGGK